MLALSFVACENPTPEPEPEPKPEPEVKGAFDVQIGEVTSSTIAYTVTPADLEAEYLCVLYDAETIEEFTRDQFIVENLMMELESEARSKGKTLAEFMPEVVDKGAITDGLFSRLAPESKYYIVVFGVDPADNYKANTAVSKTEVTTLAGQTLGVTFDVQTDVDGNSAKYTITPSNNDDVWYFYTVPVRTFDAYTDPEGAYRMSEQDFLLYCLSMDIDTYRKAGYTDNQIMNAIFHKGTLTLQAEGLAANTDYVAMVAGFIVTPQGEVTIATELTKTTYTTGEAKQKNLTFEISVTDIEAMRAAIKVTPSNNKDTYCWMCGEWDGEKTAEEVMNEIVGVYGGWMNNGAMLYTGVQDFTGGPGSLYKYKVDKADTDYYVIAFGYAGGITTVPTMKTFKTLPAPDPMDTTFEMTASNISPYGFTVGIKPSESSTYFTFNVVSNDVYAEIDFEMLVDELNADFDERLAAQQETDPFVTAATVLSMYYYRGPQTVSAAGISPETTCSGFVMALSQETGHVVNVIKFPDIATTGKLGAITPTVELVGNYSGDDENGAIFGQPAATKGKAITVVKYSDFEGATALYVTMTMDDASNAATYPDSVLWGDLSGEWGNPIDMAIPYSFNVVDWDADQTAFAYAVDADGNPGGLGRCWTRATVENKRDIEELKALVAKLYPASTSSVRLPESLVFGEGIKLEVMPVEESAPVAAPKAEVKVAAPELKGNVVMTNSYIRPFRF